MKKLKVLVSVYNISGYLMAELRELSKSAEIAVIERPCDLEHAAFVSRWVDRTRVSGLDDLVRALGGFEPDVFLCGGWADRLCLALARRLRKAGTTTVLCIDTPWQGRPCQLVHRLLSRLCLLPAFDFAWGAGEPQARHLRRLGFREERIRRGYYCADTEKFASIGEGRLVGATGGGATRWPHVFLYIGRYVAVKNMRRMERAFVRALDMIPDGDWRLRCIGGGELWDERTIHPRIEHLGYKKPAEIQDYVREAGCFVLPSVYEPWGVVVHEAALMGLPMLCSSEVQAGTKYLMNGENGFLFSPFREDDMVDAFVRMMRLPDDRLAEMGRRSHALGMSYRLGDWAETARGFAK